EEEGVQNNVLTEQTPKVNMQDSTALAAYKGSLGSFAYSATLPSATENVTTFENDKVLFKVSNKGGQIVEVLLKNFTRYDSVPLYLVEKGNASFNLTLATTDNRTLNTQDLYFEPSLTKNGDSQILSMKLKASENQYLEYRYELNPGEYMLDYSIRSQGLSGVLNSSQPVQLDWKQKAIRQSQSIQYENRYTRLSFLEDGNGNKLSQGGDDDDTATNVKWISYRQHFFSSILINPNEFSNVSFTSKQLFEDESIEEKYTKFYTTSLPLEIQGGEINTNLKWYYGPTDAKIFNDYKGLELSESIP